MSDQPRNRRKERVGIVISDSRDKTVTVEVPNAAPHRRYDRIVRSARKLHVHDEANEARVGDKVRVMETKPLSRQKRWRVVEIVERAR